MLACFVCPILCYMQQLTKQCCIYGYAWQVLSAAQRIFNSRRELADLESADYWDNDSSVNQGAGFNNESAAELR